MVSIDKALREGTNILKDNNIDTPRLDAEVILSHITGLSRLKLMVEGRNILSDGQYHKYKEAIAKRAEGVPAAYITGNKEFMGLEFFVDYGVLIPRGDTEIVVEKALKECSKYNKTIRVVDVCSGSGAIGISIAKYAQNTEVTLIDISDDAVKIMRKNAEFHGLKDRVRIIQGNLLSPVLSEKYDMVVSNPPYIETEVINTLQREVRDYEPRLALDGGSDGLNFYREITTQAKCCLRDEGVLIYEIGYNQAEAVKKILKDNCFGNIEMYKDLAGLDRCILGVNKFD